MNFNTIINRYGTNSMKFDFAAERGKPEGVLPLWVADMDFQAPPEVLADMQQSVAHGIFGYHHWRKFVTCAHLNCLYFNLLFIYFFILYRHKLRYR